MAWHGLTWLDMAKWCTLAYFIVLVWRVGTRDPDSPCRHSRPRPPRTTLRVRPYIMCIMSIHRPDIQISQISSIQRINCLLCFWTCQTVFRIAVDPWIGHVPTLAWLLFPSNLLWIAELLCDLCDYLVGLVIARGLLNNFSLWSSSVHRHESRRQRILHPSVPGSWEVALPRDPQKTIQRDRAKREQTREARALCRQALWFWVPSLKQRKHITPIEM